MSKPTAASLEIRAAMVSYAIAAVRDAFPGKTEDEYSLAESRLKTSIIRRRRGNKVEYTLSVPEANLMLARTEIINPAIRTAWKRVLETAPLEALRAEVKAAWNKACEAEGIPTDAKFVVFTNTTEAALYNELAGMLLRRLNPLKVSTRKPYASTDGRGRVTFHNKFKRGSGCYTCSSCHRQTRCTGDNGSSGLCPECYEIGGMENAVSDNGPEWEYRESTLKEIARLQEVIRQKGGKL